MVDARLARFLREARARIDPATCGVPAGGSRRVRGLRREEVAEMIGVSDGWYARFESGRGNLSVRALGRLADVLRLSASQRSELFVLARPAVAPQLGVDLGWKGGRWRQAIRDVSVASSIDELLHAFARMLHDPYERDRATWTAVCRSAPQRLEFVAVAGTIAKPAEGDLQIQPRRSWDLVRRARVLGCSDVTHIETDEMRARVRAGIRSYVASPLIVDQTCVASFGYSYRQHVSADALTVERFVALQDLGALALRGSRVADRETWSVIRQTTFLEEKPAAAAG